MSEKRAAQVHLRGARAEDLGDIARIIHDPPEPPLEGMLGAKRATALGMLLVKSGAYVSLPDTTVAEIDGRVVGMLECGMQAEPSTPLTQLLRLAPRLLMILGPALPRAVYGFWLRGRLSFDLPEGGFGVSELYVDERMRNRGIGGKLLEHADGLALEAKAPLMYVETGVTNPARRLYERHGYRAVEEKTSVAYERLTGSPGRVLMVKELTASPEASSSA